MEEEKLKDLFRDFDPEITSDSLFMSQLHKNLEAVELIKRQNAALIRRSRLAACISALAGFMAGVIFTWLMPGIKSVLNSFSFGLTFLSGPNTIDRDADILSWCIVSAISITVALCSYSFCVSAMRIKS